VGWGVGGGGRQGGVVGMREVKWWGGEVEEGRDGGRIGGEEGGDLNRRGGGGDGEGKVGGGAEGGEGGGAEGDGDRTKEGREGVDGALGLFWIRVETRVVGFQEMGVGEEVGGGTGGVGVGRKDE